MARPTFNHWIIALSEYAGVTTYTGGVGRRYAATIPEIASKGQRITVVLFPFSALIAPPPPIENVTFLIYPSVQRLPAPIRLIARPLILRLLMIRGNYDLAYMPEWLGIGSLLSRNTRLVTNLVTSMALIDDIHREPPPGVPRRLMNALQDLLESRQIRRSTAVVGVSNAVLRWNEQHKHLPLKRAVVRNCIDIQQVRDLSAGPLPDNFPTSAQSMLFVGRLERRKGIETAASAFNLAVSQNPNLHLVLAGGFGDSAREPGRDGILQMIAAKHHDRVTFLGDTRTSLLYAAMAHASVVVCPSDWEAFGNVALEAKAAGAPLVVTTGSGFDDFCENEVDCLAVPPRDPVRLADAVTKIVGDTALARRITERAAGRVENFSAAAVAGDILRTVVQLAS